MTWLGWCNLHSFIHAGGTEDRYRGTAELRTFRLLKVAPEDPGEDAVHRVGQLVDGGQDGDFGDQGHDLGGRGEDVADLGAQGRDEDGRDGAVDQAQAHGQVRCRHSKHRSAVWPNKEQGLPLQWRLYQKTTESCNTFRYATTQSISCTP